MELEMKRFISQKGSARAAPKRENLKYEAHFSMASCSAPKLVPGTGDPNISISMSAYGRNVDDQAKLDRARFWADFPMMVVFIFSLILLGVWLFIIGSLDFSSDNHARAASNLAQFLVMFLVFIGGFVSFFLFGQYAFAFSKVTQA